MTSLLKILFPDYDPPATVESANVRPGDTRGLSGAELDGHIQEMFSISDRLVAQRDGDQSHARAAL